MFQDFIPLALLLILLGAWIALPLIPAWITYRITPAQRIFATGPLQGLTVKASGAFAAYLIVLLIVSPVVNDGRAHIGAIAKPSWTVTADVSVLGRDGKAVTLPAMSKVIAISFNPDLHDVLQQSVKLKLPGNPPDWPRLVLQIPSYGGSPEINLADIEIQDGLKKIARLRQPVVIRQFPAEQFGFGVPATRP